MGFHERHIEKGSGPAVIFSHGTLMDATMFDPQLDHLAERGYRAIACNSRTLTGDAGPAHAGRSGGGLPGAHGRPRHREVRAGRHVGRRLHGPGVRPRLPGAAAGAHRHRRHLAGLHGGRAEGLPRAVRQAGRGRHGAARVRRVGRALLLRRDDARQQRGARGHWIDRWATTVPARAVLFQGRSWLDKADITARLDGRAPCRPS